VAQGEGLSSSPSTTKKKKRGEGRREGGREGKKDYIDYIDLLKRP
jgi:hypothetical protein